MPLAYCKGIGMNRILIVDDEHLILNTTCSYVEEHFDAEVFRASSGFEALDILRKLRFDVVITDISMPLMDGMELTRNVKRLWPQCYVIILTVYDRFDYAYEIVKYTQVDYVLKSQGMAALHTAIQRALDYLQEEARKERLFSSLGRQIEQVRPQMTLEMIRRLLQTGQLPSGEERNATGFVLDSDRPVLLMCGALDPAHQAITEGYLPGIIDVVRKRIENRNIICFLCSISNEIVGIFQAPEHSESVDDNDAVYIQDALDHCIESLESDSDVALAVVIADAFESWQDIPKTYRRIRLALESVRNSSVLMVSCKVDELSRKALKCITEEGLQALWQLIYLGNAAELHMMMGQFLLPARSVPDISELYPYADAFALCYLYVRGCDTLGIAVETDSTAYHIVAYGDHVNGSIWADAAIDLFDDMFRRQAGNRVTNGNELVASIDNYILHHYSEDLHLSTIAEAFHYSASYLSRLYKESTGNNLTAGINNVRIEAACKLLQTTQLSIGDVGHRCGFYSNKYFIQVFKKATGVTPSQFRKSDILKCNE